MFLFNKRMKIQLLEFLLDHQRFRKIPCPENPTELYVVQISFYLSSSFLPFDQDWIYPMSALLLVLGMEIWAVLCLV